MSLSTTPIVYADDVDATIIWPVTDSTGANVDLPATCALDGGTYTVTGTWLDAVAATRRIRVPVAGLTAGAHQVYLKVPGGTDLRLGTFYVRTRT